MSLLKYKDYERRMKEEYDDNFKEGYAEKPTINDVEILNETSIDALCLIKGVGPKTAEKIKNNAPYEDLETFSEQAGISEKIADKVLTGLGLRSGKKKVV